MTALRPRRGPHRVLQAVYAIFVIAAVGRASVQISTQFSHAPVAYSLDVVAAAAYVIGWFAIGRAANGHPALASVMLWVEIGGVVVIGTLSLVVRSWFPDSTIWSVYGEGYGFVPAVLPVAALFWLHRSHEPPVG